MVVGVATRPWAGWAGVRLPTTAKTFLLSETSRPPLRPTQGFLSPGVKRSGREAVHSLPPSAEVNNTWTYTSMPPYAFRCAEGRIAFRFHSLYLVAIFSSQNIFSKPYQTFIKLE